MQKRPFFATLTLAFFLATAASCTCSGDPQRTDALTGSAPAASAAPSLGSQAIKLPNGLEGELVTGPCGESAALVVLLKVGLDHDPPGRSGMARLAGRLLAKAREGRAERSVETGSDYTLYSVATPGDRLPEEVDEVAAWMARATPAEADFTAARKALVEELEKLAGADAALTAQSLAEEAVAPARGNGKRGGIAAEVEAIPFAELQAFWQEHFTAGNARVVVTGRFDAEKARAKVDAALGPLAAGKPPVLRDAAEATVKGTLVMGETPSAVAVAVPAPALSDALFAPFLILAARLLEDGTPGRTWAVSYDPIRRPELLFLTGPVGQAEQPEPAAGRIRTEAGAILGRALSPDDAAKAKERFRLLVDALVDPEVCAKDARAFGIARARRAQLGLDAAAVTAALEATTKEQLEEAAKLFEPKRTAAVIAGGAIR